MPHIKQVDGCPLFKSWTGAGINGKLPNEQEKSFWTFGFIVMLFRMMAAPTSFSKFWMACWKGLKHLHLPTWWTLHWWALPGRTRHKLWTKWQQLIWLSNPVKVKPQRFIRVSEHSLTRLCLSVSLARSLYPPPLSLSRTLSLYITLSLCPLPPSL